MEKRAHPSKQYPFLLLYISVRGTFFTVTQHSNLRLTSMADWIWGNKEMREIKTVWNFSLKSLTIWIISFHLMFITPIQLQLPCGLLGSFDLLSHSCYTLLLACTFMNTKHTRQCPVDSFNGSLFLV